MSIVSQCGNWSSDDPKLALFHESRNAPMLVVCTKDNPTMHGFGRTLKAGDVVEIKGTCCHGGRFDVSVPKECAFYDYSHFEPAAAPSEGDGGRNG